MPEKLTKRITIRVTEGLHRATKAKAAKQGLTVQETVTALLKEWLGKELDEDSKGIQNRT